MVGRHLEVVTRYLEGNVRLQRYPLVSPRVGSIRGILNEGNGLTSFSPWLSFSRDFLFFFFQLRQLLTCCAGTSRIFAPFQVYIYIYSSIGETNNKFITNYCRRFGRSLWSAISRQRKWIRQQIAFVRRKLNLIRPWIKVSIGQNILSTAETAHRQNTSASTSYYYNLLSFLLFC